MWGNRGRLHLFCMCLVAFFMYFFILPIALTAWRRMVIWQWKLKPEQTWMLAVLASFEIQFHRLSGMTAEITESCHNCPYSVDIETRSIPNASQTCYRWINCCNSFNAFLWERRAGAVLLTKFCVGGDEIYEFSVYVFLEEKLFFPYNGTKVSQ